MTTLRVLEVSTETALIVINTVAVRIEAYAREWTADRLVTLIKMYRDATYAEFREVLPHLTPGKLKYIGQILRRKYPVLSTYLVRINRSDFTMKEQAIMESAYPSHQAKDLVKMLGHRHSLYAIQQHLYRIGNRKVYR